LQNIFDQDERDILGYCEPLIGDLRPDFLLLSPHFGVSNPIDQISKYWKGIENRINACHFKQSQKPPIIQIIILANIEKDSDVGVEINKLMPQKVHCCFKGELRKVNFAEFMKPLIEKNISMTEKQFETLQANLIPLARLPEPTQKKITDYLSEDDQIKLLDNEQQKIAFELGEGHRLFFGVAGSGKTILLIARARYLAIKHPTWRILVLCYNRVLSQYIYQLLSPQDYEAHIFVDNFHKWAKEYIQSAGIDYEAIYNKAQTQAERQKKWTEFFQDVVPKLLLQILEQTEISQYDAILIDEAQDFDEKWFKILLKVLNPQYNSLFIACDGLQGIYARKRFHWSDVGVNARGRVMKFTKSYRNPKEIAEFASALLPTTLLELINTSDEFLPTIEFSGRHGYIDFELADSRQQEYAKIIEKIKTIDLNDKNILILFRKNLHNLSEGHPFLQLLEENNICCPELTHLNFQSTGIILGTPYGTKGLECDIVIIPEIDAYNSDQDRQLLYVGMTRSKYNLILTASRTTPLVGQILAKTQEN
jgi:superfamily I DNA and RNA helicase